MTEEKKYNCDKAAIVKHLQLYHDMNSAHYSKSLNHIFSNSKK